MVRKFIPGADDEDNEPKEIVELLVPRVDMVGRPANLRRFTLLKSEDAVVACGNCGATHSAEQLRKVAGNMPGVSINCKCGHEIKIEVRKGEAEDKAADEAKAKAESDAKAKAESEKASKEDGTQQALEGIAVLEKEKEVLVNHNKELEKRLGEKDTELTQLKEKVQEYESEQKELEKTVVEALEVAEQAAGIEHEKKE